MRRARILTAMLAGVLVVAVLAVAAVVALGGSDDSSAARPAAGEGPPPGADGAALDGLRECLAKQGVDLPEPGDREPGQGPPAGFDPSDPDLQAAFEACRSELPEGGPPGPGAP